MPRTVLTPQFFADASKYDIQPHCFEEIKQSVAERCQQGTFCHEHDGYVMRTLPWKKYKLHYQIHQLTGTVEVTGISNNKPGSGPNKKNFLQNVLERLLANGLYDEVKELMENVKDIDLDLFIRHHNWRKLGFLSPQVVAVVEAVIAEDHGELDGEHYLGRLPRWHSGSRVERGSVESTLVNSVEVKRSRRALQIWVSFRCDAGLANKPSGHTWQHGGSDTAGHTASWGRDGGLLNVLPLCSADNVAPTFFTPVTATKSDLELNSSTTKCLKNNAQSGKDAQPVSGLDEDYNTGNSAWPSDVYDRSSAALFGFWGSGKTLSSLLCLSALSSPTLIQDDVPDLKQCTEQDVIAIHDLDVPVIDEPGIVHLLEPMDYKHSMPIIFSKYLHSCGVFLVEAKRPSTWDVRRLGLLWFEIKLKNIPSVRVRKAFDRSGNKVCHATQATNNNASMIRYLSDSIAPYAIRPESDLKSTAKRLSIGQTDLNRKNRSRYRQIMLRKSRCLAPRPGRERCTKTNFTDTSCRLRSISKTRIILGERYGDEP